ncbi:hypothetical protein BDV11DRAFT_96776 [Aspergillus similis]
MQDQGHDNCRVSHHPQATLTPLGTEVTASPRLSSSTAIASWLRLFTSTVPASADDIALHPSITMYVCPERVNAHRTSGTGTDVNCDMNCTLDASNRCIRRSYLTDSFVDQHENVALALPNELKELDVGPLEGLSTNIQHCWVTAQCMAPAKTRTFWP